MGCFRSIHLKATYMKTTIYYVRTKMVMVITIGESVQNPPPVPIVQMNQTVMIQIPLKGLTGMIIAVYHYVT